MGFACRRSATSTSLATLNLLLKVLYRLMTTTILEIITSPLQLLGKSLHRPGPERSDNGHAPCNRPLASLVPLPPHLVSESIKKRLPVTSTSEFMVDSTDFPSPPTCVVCMDGVGAKEEIRQLSNCRHVFHAECLDRCIDAGHVTCPLCRSKLIPHHHEGGGEAEGDPNCGGDPWRMERMVYLFGEDFVMGT